MRRRKTPSKHINRHKELQHSSERERHLVDVQADGDIDPLLSLVLLHEGNQEGTAELWVLRVIVLLQQS